MIDPISVEWKTTQVDFSGVDIKMVQFDATIELHDGRTKHDVFDFTKFMLNWCAERFALGTTPEEIKAGGFWNVNVFHTAISTVEITPAGLVLKDLGTEMYNVVISMGPEYAMQFSMSWPLKPS
jgi:hypothetical protein